MSTNDPFVQNLRSWQAAGYAICNSMPSHPLNECLLRMFACRERRSMQPSGFWVANGHMADGRWILRWVYA